MLVVSDGSAMVQAVKDRLDDEGVPNTVISLDNPNRPTITPQYLATTNLSGIHGAFAGIVLPTDSPGGMTVDERAAIASYEAAFGVREFSAYNWANPGVGLNYAADPGYVGPVDGMTAQVTSTGLADAFSYLRGSLTFDDLSPAVDESYGYLAVPLTTDPTGGTFTPLVTASIPGTAASGSVLGVYTQGGRERLISTVAMNSGQQHWRVLSHGIVTWLTRGVSLSFNRNFFSVHVDDVLLPDSRWSVEGNCTIGEGCDPVAYPPDAPGSTMRMTAADTDRLLAWQQANDMKIDMVFNGFGRGEYLAESGATTDPLSDSLVANRAALRWINHTWSHQYLGCIQAITLTSWSCQRDILGNTQYYPLSGIQSEITKNRQFARGFGITLDNTELVTGEHSGLRILPQMAVDNPNLALALLLTNVKWIASDASRERDPRIVGTATTVPRHPTNIYFNVGRTSEEVDEYNWLYTSRANGGSGYCEDHPETTTCIAPLDPVTGWDQYILPMEARIALSHVVDNDARPHYAHQGNLAEDGILYPVLDKTLTAYRDLFATNAPIVNPSMRAAGQQLLDQSKWTTDQAGISAKITAGKLVVTNNTLATVRVPLTAPTGTLYGSGAAFGESYAGQLSTWRAVGALSTVTLKLGSNPGFLSPTSWPVAPAAAAASTNLTRPSTALQGSRTAAATSGGTTLSSPTTSQSAKSPSTRPTGGARMLTSSMPTRTTRVVPLPEATSDREQGARSASAR